MSARHTISVCISCLGVGTAGGTAAAAVAYEPPSREFILAQPIHGTDGGESAVGETLDGDVLVLAGWPLVVRPGNGSELLMPRDRLLRIDLNGSRSFLSPFGDPAPNPRFEGERFNVDDVLPLADGSVLYALDNTIGQARPDGSVTTIAGTGAFRGDDTSASGEGGPATTAALGRVGCLARMADGSTLFCEDDTRIRRVRLDGTLETVAGSDVYGFSGDGGPATAAKLKGATDVLPAPDGGFLIADMFNNRIRRVSASGRIDTFAGRGGSRSSGVGGAATAARMKLPHSLARLPDGSVVIAEWAGLRRVAPDGVISTLLDPADRATYSSRPGDAHVGDIASTREGGLLASISGEDGVMRIHYIAPVRSERTLVALRGVRTSDRRVTVRADFTKPGVAELEVSRRGRIVARSTRAVGRGLHWFSVSGRFRRDSHAVTVKLEDRDGIEADERVVRITSSVLTWRWVRTLLGPGDRPCRRFGQRRIDCTRFEYTSDLEETGCYFNLAMRLAKSGLIMRRLYPGCAQEPQPLMARPRWDGPWSHW